MGSSRITPKERIRKISPYKILKLCLENGSITKIRQITSIVSATRLAKDLKINYITFLKKIGHPDEFKIRELKTIADLANVDSVILIKLILQED